MKRLILISILLLSRPVHADHLPEKHYQAEWCDAQQGVTEYVLPDKTRCDCLTDDHSVEFDFGKKWAESIGQSLYYSLQTGKRAGIVLILETPAERRFWIRLNSTIEHFKLPIDTWQTGAGAAQ